MALLWADTPEGKAALGEDDINSVDVQKENTIGITLFKRKNHQHNRQIGARYRLLNMVARVRVMCL